MLRTSTIRRFSFINSRAHEGRDTPPGNGRRTATQFQLTRPRGARHFVFAPGPILKPFQLTRPRGARPARSRFTRMYAAVSTHAPARGATVKAAATHVARGFQLTRPRGARPLCHGAHDAMARFQLTRPRGARQPRKRAPPSMRRFNSRAREGRDSPSFNHHGRRH